MSSIAAPSEFVAPPTARAALVLEAIAQLKLLDLPHPSNTEVIDALGVSRARAYDLKARLQEHLGELVKPIGRPKKSPPSPAPAELATKLLAYLYENPGAVSGSSKHHRYSRAFRLLVLKLIEGHCDLDLESIAHTIAVPLPTLRDWIKGGILEIEIEPEQKERPPALSVRESRIATILDEHKRWSGGGFVAFCEHIQRHLHIPWGRTAISTILRAYGVREPARRPGRTPDESALRKAFETFFPNVQWVGDGTKMAITINGTRHVFNLELMVDPPSGAFVGANIRPTEDAEAVILAYDDASDSTESTPFALLLDNKPSNHATEVIEAIEPTVVMAATPFRPQNKAHVEGGFGLLKPVLEDLEITASTPTQFAAAILTLMVTVWGRTINHRPRNDRNGSTRAQLLQHKPTPEEIEQAQQALADIIRRQDRARRTQAARQDPVVRTLIAEALARLNLDDPTGNFQTAIAAYPLDAVVESIAIFEGKQRTNSLPDEVDVRYLRGITRNVAQDREAWAIMETLWQGRVRAGDLLKQRLEAQRQDIATSNPEPAVLIAKYIDEAVAAQWLPERFFWLKTAADLITQQPTTHHEQLTRQAARRIQATYRLPNRDRQAAIRFLAAQVLPLR